MGHPGKESMTKQLRRSCWWPRYSSDIRDFQESCVPCAAAVDRNTTPPMQLRETPDRPWQHCSADYKGPVAGKYYFHVLIDKELFYDFVLDTFPDVYQFRSKKESIRGLLAIFCPKTYQMNTQYHYGPHNIRK